MSGDEKDALAREKAEVILGEWCVAVEEIAAVAESPAEADEIAQAAHGAVTRGLWARGILTRSNLFGLAGGPN